MNIETTDNSPLLQECIEELISSKIDEGKGRTAGNYRSAWNKLSTFLGPRVTEFTFADLTTDFLHHYLLWLMQGEDGKQAPLKPGSLDFYIRNLKTMYNKIAQDKQMDVQRKPILRPADKGPTHPEKGFAKPRPTKSGDS